MKKLFSLILVGLLIGFTSCSSSDDDDDIKTIRVSAGMLAEYLDKNDLSDVEKISVRGDLNFVDFQALETLKKLTYIDLQSVSIKSISLQYNGKLTTFPENELSGDFFHGIDGQLRFPNLTTIYLPNSLVTLGDKTLQDYTKLTEVKMFNRLKTIGKSAFYGCSAIEELVIPTTVETINEMAFYNCQSLKKINLPEKITSVERSLFQGCESLTELVLPASVKSIGQTAFAKTGLVNLELPEQITDVPYGAFKDCKNLKTVKLPAGLTAIDVDAFLNCQSMVSITIPKDVTFIGKNSFGNCPLNQVHAQMTNPTDKSSEDAIFSGFDSECVLYVPIGSKVAYSANSLWNVFSKIVEE